jgi:hypothetical protein
VWIRIREDHPHRSHTGRPYQAPYGSRTQAPVTLKIGHRGSEIKKDLWGFFLMPISRTKKSEEQLLQMEKVFDSLNRATLAYPLKAMAYELNIGNSTLRHQLNRFKDYKLSLQTTVQILIKTGNYEALDIIESMLGRVAFSLPEPKGKITDLMDMTADLTKEFAEHIGAVSMAMKDKRLTQREARKCLEEVKDVIEAGIRIKAYLEKML